MNIPKLGIFFAGNRLRPSASEATILFAIKFLMRLPLSRTGFVPRPAQVFNSCFYLVYKSYNPFKNIKLSYAIASFSELLRLFPSAIHRCGPNIFDVIRLLRHYIL